MSRVPPEDDLSDDDARYIPTPEQIRDAAAEIRATWSEDRWRRAAGARCHGDIIPVVRDPDLSHGGQ